MRNIEDFSVDARKVLSYSLERTFGLKEYRTIMERFEAGNIVEDHLFKRAFTHLYKVRRSARWLKRFYNYFQLIRERPIGIREAINGLASIGDGRTVELSFASKMLHTIDPNLPIYDQFVAKTLELPKMPQGRCAFEVKLESAVAIYEEMVAECNFILKQESTKKAVKEFDILLPDYSWITPMKKLDFFLWASRD